MRFSKYWHKLKAKFGELFEIVALQNSREVAPPTFSLLAQVSLPLFFCEIVSFLFIDKFNFSNFQRM